MIQRFFSIAYNTFVETVCQPIYGVILLATAFMLVMNVSLAAFTLDDDNKMLLDIGLSTLLLSGLFLSAFSATGVLAREIQNKTVLSVISKPVSRPLFIIAKFVGLHAALVLAFYLSVLIFILGQRHGVMETSSTPWDGPVWAFGGGSLVLSGLIAAYCNYLYGKNFPITVIAIVTPLLTIAVLLVGKFDEHWDVIPFGSNFVGGQVLIAAFLVLLTVTIIAAVALAASARFGQMMTLMICTVVLALGTISDSAFGARLESSTLANIAYHTIPNFGIFSVIDGLSAGTAKTIIPIAYVGYATAYAGLITVGIIAIAVAAFQKREIG